jgi:hypothetical protein
MLATESSLEFPPTLSESHMIQSNFTTKDYES